MKNYRDVALDYPTLHMNADSVFKSQLSKAQLEILEKYPTPEKRFNLLLSHWGYSIDSPKNTMFSHIVVNDDAFLRVYSNPFIVYWLHETCGLYNETNSSYKHVYYFINTILSKFHLSKKKPMSEEDLEVDSIFKDLEKIAIDSIFKTNKNEIIKEAAKIKGDSHLNQTISLFRSLNEDISYINYWMVCEDKQDRKIIIELLELNEVKDLSLNEFLDTARKIKTFLIEKGCAGISDYKTHIEDVPLSWILAQVD